MPSMTELMEALPEPAGQHFDLQASWSLRPVPVGCFHRLRVLGTLQAKIGAAYLFYWLRGYFVGADEKQRLLAEAHWRTAARVLDTMSYLRGAVMKVGQTLASFPDIAPREFVETLDQLHFRAPPMHWSLLREMVFAELGDEPENLFASLDKAAFAAASLGQVHRARLKSGQEVAVKIQYPGVARTIREDVRNLMLFLAPARLSRDWDNTKEQFGDLRARLERETDYEQEAAAMRRARALFREGDGVVIPRVYGEFCTARVLTMDYVPGVHLDQLLAANPTQERRDSSEIGPDDHDRLRLTEEFADWQWRARSQGGVFDFGDEADFRSGVDLLVEMVRKRYSRARPCTPVIARQHFGWRSMLYQLRAKLDISVIAEAEVGAAGWDRSEYAPRPKAIPGRNP